MVVKLMPKWLAPNVITVVAFLIRVITHFYAAAYCWELRGDVPFLPCFLLGMGFFIYEVLDNVDGKQARNTGNSTPLGLLFDHGADSLDAVLITLSLCGLLQTGSSIYYPLIVSTVLLAFFYATLETYYLGKMDLPACNGVSDGAVGQLIIYFVTAIFGTGLWKLDIFGHFTTGNAVALVIILGTVPTIYLNFHNIVTKTHIHFMSIILNSLVMFAICVTFWLHYSLSELSEGYIRLLGYLYGLLISKLLFHLMLAYITAQKFQSVRISILTTCAISVINLLVPRQVKANEVVLVFGLLICNILVYIQLITEVCAELKAILVIEVFRVKKIEETPKQPFEQL